MAVKKKKPSKAKIKVNAHCVNSSDWFTWMPGTSPCFYIDSDFLKQARLVRQGIMFCGSRETQLKKMRELAAFLEKLCKLYERIDAQEAKELADANVPTAL